MTAFIRPEAAAMLRRWTESAVMGGGTVVAVWIGATSGGVVGWILAALALIVGGAATRTAILRARLGADGDQRVTVHEGRIVVYGRFGPQRVALDALVRVEATAGASGPAWLLTDLQGCVVVIPFAQDPKRQTLDALAALPGFRQDAVVAALSSGAGVTTVWRRPSMEVLDPEDGAENVL